MVKHGLFLLRQLLKPGFRIPSWATMAVCLTRLTSDYMVLDLI